MSGVKNRSGQDTFPLGSTKLACGFIGGAGAIPLRLWIRAVTVGIPHICVHKQRICICECQCRPSGYEPSVAERPKTGGSSMSMSVTVSVSVRPLWNQGVPSVETTTTGLAVKVTPSPCPLKSVGHPGGKNNFGSPTLTEDRSTGGLALPGDYPSTGPTPIRTVWWLGSLST